MEGYDMLKYALIIFLALVLVFIFMKLYTQQTVTIVKKEQKDKDNASNKHEQRTKQVNSVYERESNGKDEGGGEGGGEASRGFEGYENNSSTVVTGFSNNGDFGDVLAPVPRSENSPEVSFKTCDLNKVSPKELLPSTNTEFNQLNPSVPNSLENKNFLEAGAHIGLDTVGQSLRNASHDLRAEPPNPQRNVSPWMNSTIEADPTRRPLC
jgi:hypothetical protein